MATTQLDSNQWKDYFDKVSRELAGKEIYVEVTGQSLGDQLEAEWLPLNGLTYDPKDDLLEIATDKIDHLIHHPSAIHVDYQPDGLHYVEVIDSDGNHQIIRLREPMHLTVQ